MGADSRFQMTGVRLGISPSTPYQLFLELWPQTHQRFARLNEVDVSLPILFEVLFRFPGG